MLRPKTDAEVETAWADPWEATRESLRTPRFQRDLAQAAGQIITDAIRRDPAEAQLLRKARQDVREGRKYPRRAGTRSS